MPYNASTQREIHDWIRHHGQPGNNVEFHDIWLHFLPPTVAYATAIEEQHFPGQPGQQSRVTFLFLKKGHRWGVIHAHYSFVPKEA
jgi:hypothetical protein